MKQAYISQNFKPATLDLIKTINGIVTEYVDQGYRLTVRQLYYQLVARGVIENTIRSYKNAASVISDGRLAGLIDWDAIEDRTREFIRRSHWDTGGDILRSAAQSFHMDMWENQKSRVFVVVEKEALAGVLDRVCREFDVPLLAARGYPSGTVLREFSLSDLIPCIRSKQTPYILHLGDHDPSGLDMTRDLSERFAMFIAGRPAGDLGGNLSRIALNMPQVEELKPPPNPAKTTDARYDGYRREFGEESWELDALPPEYLSKLVRTHIKKHIDKKPWSEREQEIEDIRERITKIADDFED